MICTGYMSLTNDDIELIKQLLPTMQDVWTNGVMGMEFNSQEAQTKKNTLWFKA